MGRPTFGQLEALAKFLEENPGIAKAKMRSAQGKQSTKRKWEEIAVTLNSIGGAKKDAKSWAKYWADKKCTLRKFCVKYWMSLRNGGVEDCPPSLTPLEQRLVAVFGGMESIVGELQIPDDSFQNATTSASHESSQNTEDVEITILDETEPDFADTKTERETEHSPASPSSASDRDRSPLRPQSSMKRSPRSEDEEQTFSFMNTKPEEAENATPMRDANANMELVANAINNLAGSVIQAAHIIALALRDTAKK
ncbi:uncharacterized protein LOC142983182 [Anticarsia gemmatalis]|uniref:uncharacterized protein LOC142983182 n=1 Tax=Anticarsia gemmatalis TaxID=129554 RepID=UPI003F7766A3